MSLESKPHVRVRLRCRLGLHRCVPMPRPENKMMRRFVVRSIDGCTECGAVFVKRFNNILGGGGHFKSGYVHPDELKKNEAPAALPASPE